MYPSDSWRRLCNARRGRSPIVALACLLGITASLLLAPGAVKQAYANHYVSRIDAWVPKAEIGTAGATIDVSWWVGAIHDPWGYPGQYIYPSGSYATFTVTLTNGTETKTFGDVAAGEGDGGDAQLRFADWLDCSAIYQVDVSMVVDVSYFSRDFGNESYFRSTAETNLESVSSAPSAGCADGPAFTIGTARVDEGASGANAASVPVTLRGPAVSTTTLYWWTVGASAVEESDYVGSSGTVTFDAGETSKAVSIPVKGDEELEPDQEFLIRAAPPGGPNDAGDLRTQGSVVIGNDDPVPSLVDRSVNEGFAGITSTTATLQFSRALPSATTLTYETADGTATIADGDYLSSAGSLPVAAGLTSIGIPVSIVGDVRAESGESFAVRVRNADGDMLAMGTVMIVNDDPTVTVSGPSSVAESAGTVQFTVTLSSPYPASVTFGLTAPSGAASIGSDFSLAAAALAFTAGSTTRTVTVIISNDVLDEYDEGFGLALTYPDGSVAASATSSISDDDLPPDLAIGDPSSGVVEGSTTALVFPVTLSAPSGKPVTVAYQTASGTATSGSDFIAMSGTLTFPEGSNAPQSVSVVTKSDTIYETTQSMLVVLGSPTNAGLSRSAATGLIVDDDLAPTVKAIPLATAEGDSGAKVVDLTVKLSAASEVTATLDYATTDASAKIALGDYAPSSGVVTIPAGQTSATVPVAVNGDSTYEANEVFRVALSNPLGARITSLSGRVYGSVKIANDDLPPVLSLDDARVVEGNSSTRLLTFTAKLSQPSGLSATVRYATVGQTAIAGVDFVSAYGTISLPAGMTSRAFTIKVIGDVATESDEVLLVNLSLPVRATLTRVQFAGTIVDDDS